MAVSEFTDNAQSPYPLSPVLRVYMDNRERRADQFRI